MNLSMTILEELVKHKGKPVVSHAITHVVARSKEAILSNESIKEQRIKYLGWTEEQVTEELEGYLQNGILYALGKLRRKGLVERVPIQRGAKLKEQIKKTGMVFMNSKWLTLCVVAYRITEVGSKWVQANRMKCSDQQKKQPTHA